MSSDAIIVRRPHFRREGHNLYFFLSSRAFHQLTPAESDVWDALESEPVQSARLKNAAAVQSLIDRGVIERIVPIEQPNRRQILVIEPHSDDAALSIGATMWKMRFEAEFHLVTMASRSNYSTAFQMHRDHFEREHITALRTAEGKLFAQHIGGHYRTAGMSEATLRYNDDDWDLAFFNAHEVSIAIAGNRRAPPAILNLWIEYIKSLLKEGGYDEIWIPLGAGTHSDHDLTRNAALNALVDERPPCVIRLYEDVPYGVHFPEHTDRIIRVLKHAGAELETWYQVVTDEFDAKLALLSVFASQFKVPAILNGVEQSANTVDQSKRIERLWTLQTLPRDLPEADLWIGAQGVQATRNRLNAFLRGAAGSKRVAIFLIGAAGRWQDDLSRLGVIFPAAKFIVYAGRRVSEELRLAGDARVELHVIDGGTRSWLKAALREFTTSHRIIVAANALSKARKLSLVWPFGRKLICSDMDHLMQALADRCQ